MDAAASRPARTIYPRLGPAWLLVAGFCVLAIPTLVSLGSQSWAQDTGAQGPIILATGAWLVWRQWPALRQAAVSGNPWFTAALLVPALAIYVFGRAYDAIYLEAGGLYVAGLAMFQAGFGARAMLRNWFPFFYLGFAVPPPQSVLVGLTAPLKHFVSFVSTDLLALCGAPVVREGVTIVVAQYQLLVEDACSGMNSIIGLSAISLLYVYLLRGSSPLYSLLLTAFVIPIAIVANIIRIMILILLTYGYGDAVAQSFLHVTAGLVLFAIALALVFALDRLLFPIVTKLTRPR